VRRTMVIKIALAALAGAVVGFGAWWLGPAVGIPVALGLVVTLGLLALDQMRVRVLRTLGAQSSTLTSLQRSTKDQSDRVRRDLGDTERRLKDIAVRDFAQTEALLNLHQLAQVSSGMPATRGWAASPDLLLLLVSLVEQRRPATVLDLGSGSTTLWMATAMRTHGMEGRIVAIDHDLTYAQLTQQALVAHGLEKYVDLRHAPLTDLDLAGEAWPWYDVDVLADVRDVDLLVVDGPPGILRSQARYPALPTLLDRLTPDALVVLDDYARPDETALVVRWREEFPGWSLRELAHEKGTAILSRS
jgi:predicted O-methyltransferase YrrM